VAGHPADTDATTLPVALLGQPVRARVEEHSSPLACREIKDPLPERTMRHLLPLLLLGLSGCHIPTLASLDALASSSYGGSIHDRYDRYDRSHDGGRSRDRLDASLWFDPYDRVASFELSRAAHVAVFVLHPTGEAELIYPTAGNVGRAYFGSGAHAVRTRSWGQRVVRSGYQEAATYVVLIAAERALNTARFLSTGGFPWRGSTGTGWSPYGIAEALALEIVPYPHDTEWTVAYEPLWPQGGGYYRDGWIGSGWASGRGDGWTRRWVRVACPGGTVISVPEEELRRGRSVCPTGRLARQPREDTTRAAVPRVTETLPKRPRPEGWQGPGSALPARPGVTDRTERPLREGTPATSTGVRRILPAPGARSKTPAAPSKARPAPRPSTGSPTGPATRPRPAARPPKPSSSRPAVRPSSSGSGSPARPRPKAKPKTGGGGTR
jgi:hypothetical protein